PGEPSAGATSPLWVMLLAIGYLAGPAPYVLTFLLGWLFLFVTGVFCAAGFARLRPKFSNWAIGAGALVILDFHMAWSAVSGMETIFFAALCTLVLLLVLLSKSLGRSNLFWGLAGSTVGAAAWVRPEGLTLIAPLVLVAMLSNSTTREKQRRILSLFFSFGLVLLLYLAFNHSISGGWWPNTLAAKQAEYSSLLGQPFLTRFAQQLAQPLVGAGLLIFPGFFFAVFKAAKTRDWAIILCVLWILGFLALFASRLPVIYQHGRYAMPTIPIYLLISAIGLADLFQTILAKTWRRRLSVGWLGGLAMLSIGVLFLGANAYSNDLDFINTQMIATAKWVAENTSPDSLVAAHDIGALGYFSNRKIVDLAGLVSPQVIPFIRDETGLSNYLDHAGADYLVAFPSWYPLLTADATPAFRARSNSYESMTVFGWPKSP
ncbi:MAG TPA: hypothetical protein VLK33_06275, partial [Terriglobales bacterium]|nr:hypothetical protein [Terriglobales bacterium]